MPETLLHYLYALMMMHDTKDRQEENAITYDSPSHSRAVTEVVEGGSVRIVDHESMVSFEREWQK